MVSTTGRWCVKAIRQALGTLVNQVRWSQIIENAFKIADKSSRGEAISSVREKIKSSHEDLALVRRAIKYLISTGKQWLHMMIPDKSAKDIQAEIREKKKRQKLNEEDDQVADGGDS